MTKKNMSVQKKKSSGRGTAPKGDHEPGLTPPIPFVPLKVDDEEKPPMVEVTIKKNPHWSRKGSVGEHF